MVSGYVVFACWSNVTSGLWLTLKHRHINSTFNNVVLSMFKSVQIHFHSTIHPPYMYLLHNIPTYYIKQSVTVLLFRSHVFIQNCTDRFSQLGPTYLIVYPFLQKTLHTLSYNNSMVNVVTQSLN